MANIEPGDARVYLCDLLHAEISELEPLKGGDWSTAFGFAADDRPLVARFGQHVDDFQKDRTASRFSCEDMPVPEVLTIADAPGGHCCVSERLFGDRIDDANAEEMRALIPAILRLWDRLREADAELWMADLGRPEQKWTDQLLSVDEENDRVGGWHDKMAQSSVAVGQFKESLAQLKELVRDCPNDLHLQHNDLLHYNVLVQGDRISAVFDWGCAGLGDFLYDLAIFQFYRTWFPSTQGIDWASEAKRHFTAIGLDVPDFDPRLRCCMTHVGLAGMVYSTFTGDQSELERHAERLARLG